MKAEALHTARCTNHEGNILNHIIDETKNIKETSIIYQDIIDDVFQRELKELISEDLLNDLATKDKYHQKSIIINLGINKMKEVMDRELKILIVNDQKVQSEKVKGKMNKLLLSGKYEFFENFKTQIINTVTIQNKRKKNE